MIINSITDYDKKRDKVTMDDGLTLLFYKGQSRRLRLEAGREISEEFYEKSIAPILHKRAEERVIYILKSSDKSEAELRRKLKEGYYPEETIDYVITWAQAHRYLDDERYIENYVRYRAQGKSLKKISYDLQAKGLKKELIEKVIEGLKEDGLDVDEDGQIEEELRKKHFDPETADRAAVQKLAASLMRKGYSWEKIKKHIKNTAKGFEEEDYG